MLAVIRTGGKQYLVKPGDKIKIEKIDKKEGEKIVFSDVLLFKDKEIEIGKPIAKKIKVTGKVLKEGREEKKIVFHYKAKKRQKVKKGHRQPFTEVEIVEIEKGK